ncbi:hypothetical protein RhiJN_25271 [Ceratobasidium sp. AG-Ba]|nr:hypothetical protein RhiJN_25271 [Ceratobasidium sp. AG-Ba]
MGSASNWRIDEREDVTTVPERPQAVQIGAQPNAKRPHGSAQVSATNVWWREERNYEFRHNSLDDVRQRFAGKTVPQAHEETVQSARPSKDLRLDDNAAIPQFAPSVLPAQTHLKWRLE